MNAWQNEHVLCEFACVRRRDVDNPEDMGEEFPDTECDVHWAPEGRAMRTFLHGERMARWRNWRHGRRRSGPR